MPEPDEPEEVEKEKGGGFFKAVRNVHPAILIVIGALLFFYFLNIANNGGDLKQFGIIVVVAAIIIYFLGRVQGPTEIKTISPEEAERLARVEVERKKKLGQFGHGARYWVGPNIAPQRHNNRITEYWIQLTVQSAIGTYKHKAVRVDAVKGYCTVQDCVGMLRGDEIKETKNILPEVFKFAAEQGIKEWLR